MSQGVLFGNEPEAANDLSQEDIQELLDNIELLDEDERSELLQIAAVLEERETAAACRADLIEFAKAMDKEYKVGAHHKHLASLLMDIESGKKDRITVSVAPRHGKSRLTSEFFSAWFLGNNPTKQVMLVSHTADLAVDFGRKVRNLINTPEYQKIFPGVQLSADSKSAGRWNTNQGGVFYATGVGSSLAGRGADLLLCLAGDTVVNTTEGKKLLKNINIGDKVLGLAGYNKVTKKMMTTHSVWYKINGQVKCSGEHRFLTKRGWVQAKDLRPADKIITVTVWRQLWLLTKTFLHKFLPARLGRA